MLQKKITFSYCKEIVVILWCQIWRHRFNAPHIPQEYKFHIGLVTFRNFKNSNFITNKYIHFTWRYISIYESSSSWECVLYSHIYRSTENVFIPFTPNVKPPDQFSRQDDNLNNIFRTELIKRYPCLREISFIIILSSLKSFFIYPWK